MKEVEVSREDVRALVLALKATAEAHGHAANVPMMSAATVMLWHWVNAPALCRHMLESFVFRGSGALAQMLHEDATVGTSLLSDFPLETRDACLDFFGLCLRSWKMPIAGRVLEVGCAEADWIGHALKADPSLEVTGIDWRGRVSDDRWRSVTGDARDVTKFPPNSFDWVVSISAIEHIGLGHYDKDPVDEHGDTQVMDNIRTWLRPGGSVYFDVPYTPEGYVVHGTSHRSYDEAAIRERLYRPGFVMRQQGYADRKHTKAFLPSVPTANPADKGGFYYIGNWWTKDYA